MPACPYCKAPLPLLAPRCPTCGQTIAWSEPAPPPAQVASSLQPSAPSNRQSAAFAAIPPARQAGPQAQAALASVEGVPPPAKLGGLPPLPVEHAKRQATAFVPEAPPASVPVALSSTQQVIESVGRPPPPLPEPAATVPQIEVGKVAPLWRRVLAWLIDGALIGGVFLALLSMAARLVHHGPASRQDGLDWAAETVLAYSRLLAPAAGLFAALALLYLALFTMLGGQTPGKRVARIRVIDQNGQGPSPGRAALRALLALGSGALMLMGFLWVLFDRRRQALHDKLAGTFVVLRT